MPQVEVTFDIDANGIVHVSAKDLGTGKEQKIKIEASSGLQKDEIDRMMRDATSHSDEDKRRKDEAELRNQADSLVYQTERNLEEYKDKINETDAASVREAIVELRAAVESANATNIKSALDRVTKAWHKITQAMYDKTTQGGPQGGGSAPSSDANKTGPDDVIDAEVVD